MVLLSMEKERNMPVPGRARCGTADYKGPEDQRSGSKGNNDSELHLLLHHSEVALSALELLHTLPRQGARALVLSPTRF